MWIPERIHSDSTSWMRCGWRNPPNSPPCALPFFLRLLPRAAGPPPANPLLPRREKLMGTQYHGRHHLRRSFNLTANSARGDDVTRSLFFFTGLISSARPYEHAAVCESGEACCVYSHRWQEINWPLISGLPGPGEDNAPIKDAVSGRLHRDFFHQRLRNTRYLFSAYENQPLGWDITWGAVIVKISVSSVDSSHFLLLQLKKKGWGDAKILILGQINLRAENVFNWIL